MKLAILVISSMIALVFVVVLKNMSFLLRTMYDFGFCAMDILQAVAEDSGTYEVRATNRIGSATSSITIEVKRKCFFSLSILT